MDRKLNVPPRTESQFLGQLPEVAESLLALSKEFESTADQPAPRSWGTLEILTRESLEEEAKCLAQQKEEKEREQARIQAPFARPNIPRSRIESAMKTKTMQALDDPKILNALHQWTESFDRKKP